MRSAALVLCILASWGAAPPSQPGAAAKQDRGGDSSIAPAPASAAGSKKLIEFGWDEPNTRFMREHVAAMERYPFDGLVFHVDSAKGGGLTWEMWGTRRFERGEFDPAIEDLRATRFQRFTERFLRVNVTPGGVDWFDDAAWEVVQKNFGLASRLAREGGARGFMFDVEQYDAHLFLYAKQKGRDGRSFAQYQAKVRERGSQWMREVAGEYPSITILLTFGYRLAQPAAGQDRSTTEYGMLADFLDGMLDACPDGVKLVDAWEFSYRYKRPEQFREAYESIKVKSAQSSAAGEKYKRLVSAGFGLWMDADWRTAGWNTQDFAKNYFQPAEFTAAVRAALATADEYVWVYTEKPRWWTAAELPPAYVEALENARR